MTAQLCSLFERYFKQFPWLFLLSLLLGNGLIVLFVSIDFVCEKPFEHVKGWLKVRIPFTKKKKINPINRREFFKLSKNIIWKICVASPILLYCYDKIITCASNFTLFLWRGGEDFFDSVLSNIKCQRNWNPSKQQKKCSPNGTGHRTYVILYPEPL